MTKPRRTWSQRLLIAFNLFLILACLLTAASLGLLYRKVGQLGRVELGTSLRPADDPEPGEPKNFLIVGVDDATGLAADDPVLIGRDSGPRSDTIMVLRVDPASEQAALLSFPRDLYVPIAGTGGRDRINAAMLEGPDRLVATVTEAFGIPIDHYLEVDFVGFRDVVAAVGGVPVWFPEPVRDRQSGLDVPEPGCVTLDPVQALAYARSRAFEYFRGGRWHVDGTGDLGRITRQQDFIRRALHRAVHQGARDPRRLNELLDAGIKSIRVDAELTIGELASLGNRFRGFNPDTLATYGLPVYDGVVRGAEILHLDENRAQPILDIFRGVADDNGGVELNGFTITVRNHSGLPDQATLVATALREAGFNVPSGAVINADHFDDTPTTILYTANREAEARLLARYVDPEPALEVAPWLGNSDVVLDTGPDYVGVLDVARPGDDGVSASAPTTTSSTASTTSTTRPGVVPADAPPEVAC